MRGGGGGYKAGMLNLDQFIHIRLIGLIEKRAKICIVYNRQNLTPVSVDGALETVSTTKDTASPSARTIRAACYYLSYD